MQTPLLASLFALTSLLAATGCAPCGDTTFSISSLTGTLTYDGVAATPTDPIISAFDTSLFVSWHDAHGEPMLDLEFAPDALLASGTIDLASQKATLCTEDPDVNLTCVPATGTLTVVLFHVDHCGGGDPVDDIGCPAHLEADLDLSAQTDATIHAKMHLHEDGRVIPYKGCLADRYGK